MKKFEFGVADVAERTKLAVRTVQKWNAVLLHDGLATRVITDGRGVVMYSRDAVDFLKKNTKPRPKGRYPRKTPWVRIKDKLPDSGRVVAYSPDYDDDTMTYRFLDADDLPGSSVTHWMPLESPPDF